MPHLVYIIFLFALGSCVGSFLNVVVWRMPRIQHPENEGLLHSFYTTLQGLSEPPSHCPQCNKLLKWYDNIPVLGWIHLKGKCRYCGGSISPRYPIIEAITGLLFVGYYVAFFVYDIGPCTGVSAQGLIHHQPLILFFHWWIYGLYMLLLAALLAASLIDAELFQIPLEIPWTIVPIAIAAHAVFDRPNGPGSTCTDAHAGALAVGATVGVIISIVLLNLGILPQSFAEGAPAIEPEKAKKHRAEGQKSSSGKVLSYAAADEEIEFTPGQIRKEIGKEMLFILPPMALGLLCLILVLRIPALDSWWNQLMRERWLSAMLGSMLGGLVGGFTIWITRILGSLFFGREAMGMGDVDLMVAIGAVMGAKQAVVVFFVAPFFGILISLYMIFTRKGRVLPYGPFLSMAAAFSMLFYCDIAAYFAPAVANMNFLLGRLFGA